MMTIPSTCVAHQKESHRVVKLLWQRLSLAGAAGYIMFCFSESFFWTRPTESNIGGYVAGWLLYSFLTYALFTVINYFRVRTIWALFLAGSVYGWLIEGVIMQTMYDSLPWQLSFTGLSWHAMITVLIGWFYTRKILFENKAHQTILLGLGLGLFYGVWSLNAWVQEDGGITPLPAYATFALVSTLVLVISYTLYDRIDFAAFQPSRIEIWIQIVFFAVYYLFVTLPSQLLALVILPLLLALTCLALRKNRRAETRPDILVSHRGRATWWNYLLLMTIPLVAIPLYALALYGDFMRYADFIFLVSAGIYIVTALMGGVVYLLSWVKVCRGCVPITMEKNSDTTVVHQS